MKHTSKPDEIEWAPLDDAPGPALPLTTAQAQAQIEAALQAAAAPVGWEPNDTSQDEAESFRRAVHGSTFSGKSVALILGAALLLTATVGLGAAIGGYYGARQHRENSVEPPRSGSERAVEASRSEAQDPPAPNEPSLEDDAPLVEDGFDLDRMAIDPARFEDLEASGPAPTRPAAAPRDLLLAANQARGRRRFRTSLNLYERVIREHPGGDEAYVATVAAGSILLGALRNPRAAERRFREALRLRPGGHLSEEARFGQAESLKRAGQDSRAAEAFRRYLRYHPQGVRAETARSRLESLGAD